MFDPSVFDPAVFDTTLPVPPSIEARVAWRPEQFNRITNPGFETDTSGWSVGAGINGAGTSIVHTATTHHGGGYAASMLTAATAGTGCNYDFGGQAFLASSYGRHVYRATVWLRWMAGTTQARLIIGASDDPDDWASRDIMLSNVWQPFFVDWAPAFSHYTNVQLAIVNVPAVTMQLWIDDAAVYLRDALTQVENGNFRNDTGGWATTAGINAVGTSLTRTAGDSPISGQACGQLVTSGTSGSGCNYDLGTAKYSAGRTYRARVWAKSISGSTSARLRLGSLGTAGDRGDASLTLTTDWVPYTVDWTPAADRTDVEAAFSNGTAAAMTARIAALEVYEALDDISADAASLSEGEPVLTFGRGASFDNSSAATGFANFRVINDGGKYTPANASGPLYGLLSAGRLVLIRARFGGRLYAVFGGRLRRLLPYPMDYTVQLVCTDALEDLRRIQYSELPSNPGYGAERFTALQRRDIRNYGTGSDIGGPIEGTRFWSGVPSNGKLLDYLEELNAATGSVHFIRPDADALVAWRLITVDRTKHSDASSTSETWDDDLADLSGYDVTEEAIVNRQRVNVTAYRLAEDPFQDSATGKRIVAEAWQIGRHSILDDRDGLFHIPIPADFSATLPDTALPLTVPANTRRVLHFVFSVPLGPTVAQTTVYVSGSATETLAVEGNEITLTLDAGSADAVLSYIGIIGAPLYQLPINDADEIDHQSVWLYGGEREGSPISVSRVNHPAHASGLADWWIWRYGAPRARPSATVENIFARQLSREVADRIALNFARLSLSAKALSILSFKTDVYLNSRRWVTVYELEELPAPPAGGWFTLDSSALDGVPVLAY